MDYVIEGCVVDKDGKDHAGLMVNLFKKWYYHTHFDDIRAVAVLGAREALEKHNPKSGGSFSTYCKIYVHKYIYTFIHDHTYAVRIPPHAYEKFKVQVHKKQDGPKVISVGYDELKMVPPDSQAELTDTVKFLQNYLLANFPRKHVRMFNHKFSFERTLAQIGKTFNCSGQNISVIIRRMVDHLKTVKEFEKLSKTYKNPRRN